MKKEKFKELSLEILPMIAGMMKALESKGEGKTASLYLNASDGHFNFDLYDTGWEFSKHSNDSKAAIRYQYREEIELPEQPQERAVFNHTTENVIEIAQIFTKMASENYHLLEIESEEWKQKFVEWANEFEARWTDDSEKDYPDEIGDFAVEKINSYHREAKEDGRI